MYENRGLNPYIEDVARRVGVAGYLTPAPRGLTLKSGYPGNDDYGRRLQAELDRGKLLEDFIAADVPKIEAPLLLHYAGRQTYEEALKANGKTYTAHLCEGVNNGSTTTRLRATTRKTRNSLGGAP